MPVPCSFYFQDWASLHGQVLMLLTVLSVSVKCKALVRRRIHLHALTGTDNGKGCLPAAGHRSSLVPEELMSSNRLNTKIISYNKKKWRICRASTSSCTI